MVNIVKTHDPADFLAMVPALVGMECRQSIVMLAFRGRRTCGAMRFDLPTAALPVARKRLITFVLGMMCKFPDIDGVLPVIICDDSYGPSTTPPHADLAKALARRFHDASFTVWDAVCQASDGYASYLDADNPIGGNPLSNIAESAAKNAIPASWSHKPRPARVADGPAAERKRVAAEFARLRAALAALGPRSRLPRELREIEDLPGLMERTLSWSDSEVIARAALLLLAWQGPPTRDFTMLLWATDRATGRAVFAAQDAFMRHGSLPASAEQSIGELMVGIGPRPDPRRVDAGIRILLTVVSLAATELRPAPLCMLAWLHWAMGQGSDAGRFLDEARSIAPSYGMVEVLDAMMSRGMLPEWAFDLDPSGVHDG
jgi:hypothetical protein